MLFLDLTGMKMIATTPRQIQVYSILSLIPNLKISLVAKRLDVRLARDLAYKVIITLLHMPS